MKSMETKKQIRRQTLWLREQLTQEERKKAALLMTERILGHQWFYRSGKILGFASYGSEIDTGEILQEALRMGKEVYLPRVEGEEMLFYRICSLDELVEGYRGIPEPSAVSGQGAVHEVYLYTKENAEDTLMLMPGVAFDKRRNRIGYGKGFYDRYLADKEALQLRTIAVGYRCQLLEEIPAQENDIRPYQVICL